MRWKEITIYNIYTITESKNCVMKKIILGCMLLSACHIQAQKLLTLDEAINITLNSNYGIQIAKNDVRIAELQTEKRANGYLPTVSGSGGLNGSLGGSRQRFSNGQEASTSNAFTWGGNASLRTDYTIYDRRRDLTLAQLKEALTLSDFQLRQTIEQSMLNVYNGYYAIGQLNVNIAALEESLEISRERMRRSQSNLELGQGSGLDVLNAEVDIKRDSVNLLNALLSVDNARRDLNEIMGIGIDEVYDVETDLEVNSLLNLQSLSEAAKEHNALIALNKQQLRVSESQLKIIDAERAPVLNTGLSYDFNYTDSPAGAFIDQSNSQGLSANVGVSVNLFDGSRKIRKQSAILDLTNQRLRISELEQSTERALINGWNNYQNALYILEVEQSAVATNEENFSRTQQYFDAGQVNSIEFRQAQLNLLNAQLSYNNARYNVKLAEIQLLQLSGKLME